MVVTNRLSKIKINQLIAGLFLFGNIALFISLHTLFGMEVTVPMVALEIATLLIGVWPITGYIGGFTISGSTVDVENTPENQPVRMGYLVTGVVVYLVGLAKLFEKLHYYY